MGKYGVYGNAGGRPSQWAVALEPLKSKPGVWHIVDGCHATATASYLTRGLASGLEPGDFEATTRREVDGIHAPKGKAFLFVRYVGGEEYPQPEVESDDGDRVVYQGLPCSGWRIGRNGEVEYRTTDLPRYGGGTGWWSWEMAWERQDKPAPVEPAREDLPPGDER